MPKAKPDQVVAVRIELQQKERDILEQYAAVYALQGSVKAIDELLSFENLYLGITVVEIVTGREILYGTPNDLNDLINGMREWWAANGDTLDPSTWFGGGDSEMPWWGWGLPLSVRMLLWPGSFIPSNPQNPGSGGGGGGGFPQAGGAQGGGSLPTEDEEGQQIPPTPSGPFGSPI